MANVKELKKYLSGVSVFCMTCENGLSPVLYDSRPSSSLPSTALVTWRLERLPHSEMPIRNSNQAMSIMVNLYLLPPPPLPHSLSLSLLLTSFFLPFLQCFPLVIGTT